MIYLNAPKGLGDAIYMRAVASDTRISSYTPERMIHRKELGTAIYDA